MRSVFLAVSLLTGVWTPAFSQFSITGPTCVVPGTLYLYPITARWAAGSTIEVCVSGGVLADSGSTCAVGVLSFVRVVWDSSASTSATITITSSLGNVSLPVTVASALIPGTLDSTVLNQALDTLTTPATLFGKVPTGGSCGPGYVYQWQQSPDNVVWNDISDSTGQQLVFSGPIPQTTYFRRKVTDLSSGGIAFSNVATLSVATAAPTPTIQ